MNKDDAYKENNLQVKSFWNGENVVKQKEEKIVKVEAYYNDGYRIHTDEYTVFLLQKKFTDVIPQVGDAIVFYTVWFSKVVGLELNGKLLYFLSEEDE